MNVTEFEKQIQRFSCKLDVIYLEQSRTPDAPLPDDPDASPLDLVIDIMRGIPGLSETIITKTASRIILVQSQTDDGGASVQRVDDQLVLTIPPVRLWRHLTLLAHEFSHCLHMMTTNYDDCSDLFRECVAFAGERAFLDEAENQGLIGQLQKMQIIAFYNGLYMGPKNRALQQAVTIGERQIPDILYPIARCYAAHSAEEVGGRFASMLHTQDPALADILKGAEIFCDEQLDCIRAMIDFAHPSQAMGWPILQGLWITQDADRVSQVADRYLGPERVEYLATKKNVREIQEMQNGEHFAWRRVLSELCDCLAAYAESEYHKQIGFRRFFRLEVLPPLLFRQTYISPAPVTPSGVLTWAWLSDDILAEVLDTKRMLQPHEWRSGQNLFFNDIYIRKGHTDTFFEHVRNMPLLEHSDQAHAIVRNPDGSARRIRHFRFARVQQQGRLGHKTLFT